MPISWSASSEKIDWNELSDLYTRAPLGNKSPKDLQISFGNSMYKIFAFDHDKIIGVGRALADGVDCSYICDVALLPEYQGIGLGKEIVLKLLEFSKNHKKIILYAAQGKEEFYKKIGFYKMKTAMAIFNDNEIAKVKGLIEN